MKSENESVKVENGQLKENLLSMGTRLDALETMMLALSTNPKEKLVNLDQLNSDEVRKTIQ